MRIVVASDHFPPHRSGHAVAAAWWTRALAEAGHELTVVADAPDMHVPGVRWRRLPVLPGFSDGHPLAAFRPTGTALDRLSADPPDVVHLHGYGPACRRVAAALPGVPVLLTLHQFPDGSGTPFAPLVVPVMRRLLRSTAARAAHLTVPSERARERLAQELGRDVADRSTVVPVGVDPAFRPAPSGRRATSDGRARPRIVYVGRRTPDKGFERFERLARRHPEADWHAVGTGPAGAPSYRVTHHLGPAGVADALRKADALLAPGPYETQGIAVLEALACGTAVAVPAGSAQAEPVAEGVHGACYATSRERGDDETDAAAWRAIERATALSRAGTVAIPHGYERPHLAHRMTAALHAASASRRPWRARLGRRRW